MSGVTIGGEEEHTFGEIVEPADVGEPGRIRYDVEHRSSSLRIGARRHHAGRFVEYEPGCVLARRDRANPTTVDGDVIAIGVNGLPDLGDMVVDGHPPCRDELLCVSPRSNAGARERALDAHWLDHGRRLYSGMDAGTGARSAIANSSARGNSSRWRSAKCSRKTGVVPYMSGRPRPSPRPTTSIRPRS